jgi:hypothetical protein
MEAQWHLARSVVATGEKDEAKKELHRFLDKYHGSPYEEEARILLNQQELRVAKSVSVIWAPEKTTQLKDLLLRFPNVTINTVLLEISDKQLKKSVQAATASLPNDPLFNWIDLANKMGLRVFLITPFRSTAESDIFNSDVKKRLLLFYHDIARYPLNGIYVNEIAYGVKEGWTPNAIAAYEALFLEQPKTTSLRFVGFRSRHITQLLNEIWDEIQLVSPEIEFGIGVPEILLMDPAKGLLETSLDYLELKEAAFDFYVVASVGSGAQRVSESLLKYGRLDKIWFNRTRKETISSLLEMPIQGIIVTTP